MHFELKIIVRIHIGGILECPFANEVGTRQSPVFYAHQIFHTPAEKARPASDHSEPVPHLIIL